MPACEYPQTRNWATGRCRKPCSKHQAINPTTGKCVSKTYLKCLNRETCGDLDLTYAEDMSLDDKNLERDLKQGLVDDPECFPRKRNIHTGYCKTPCQDGYAMNPRTGGCVTLEFLKCLDPEDYDTDDDDEMAAKILFTPTDISSKQLVVNLPAHDGSDRVVAFGNDTLDRSIKTSDKLLSTSHVGVADTAVMRGIFESAVNAKGARTLAGTYDPAKRKLSCGRSDISSHAECGITTVSSSMNESLVSASLVDPSIFVWSVYIITVNLVENSLNVT